jgi:competence protein ComFC
MEVQMARASNKLSRFSSKIVESILSLVYPPLCLSCKSYTKQAHLLCQSCSDQLELLQVQHRCPICFFEFESANKCCSHCPDIEPLWDFAASCFTYKDPVRALILKLKYNNCPYLAKTLASFMYIQHVQLGWPTPDLVIYVPQSRLRSFERGYNQSECLAKCLASFLNVPCRTILKKQRSTYPQTLLEERERKKLQQDTFCLKPSANIEDKTVLIIDDVYTTGSTLNRCSKALLEGYPRRIFALTAAIKN